MQKDPQSINEVYQFLVKIIPPAVIGIAASLAVKMKREKLSIGRVIISFVTGISCAYFAYPFVESFSNHTGTVIGIVAISGEKITEWVVYKFRVDVFLGVLADFILEKIRGKK